GSGPSERLSQYFNWFWWSLRCRTHQCRGAAPGSRHADPGCERPAHAAAADPPGPVHDHGNGAGGFAESEWQSPGEPGCFIIVEHEITPAHAQHLPATPESRP